MKIKWEIKYWLGTKKVFSKTPYVNGERHGEEVRYHKNGKESCRCFWVNGQKHGEEVWYHKNGKKNYRCFWVNGKRHEIIIKYKN